jgi:hypothetical protein
MDEMGVALVGAGRMAVIVVRSANGATGVAEACFEATYGYARAVEK